MPKKGGTEYPLINDVKSLLWVVNQNTVTPHVWTAGYRTCITLTSASSISTQDVTSLTPARGSAAVRDLLDELGQRSWIKTSGSKGYHIAVPLDGKAHVGDAADSPGESAPPGQARSDASDAGVQQGRSGRTYSR